ncbi:Retrovirus-related Pol polyprotein, partial [Aphis craccivora]
FNWPELKQEVRDCIKNCPSCQTNKTTNRHHRSPMIITTTSSKPFEKIFMDIVGPLIPTAIGNT